MEKKSKLKYFVLPLFLMLISVVSVSYALTTLVLEGKKNYSLVIGTLDFEIEDEQNSIRLLNAYPMADSVGTALTPYTFKITNTGTLDVYYKVSLVEDEDMKSTCTDCVFLSPSKLRYQVSIDGTSKEIGNLSSSTILDSGSIEAGTSINYTLRVWMDYSATSEEENKYYYGKIKVEASQERLIDGITTADLIRDVQDVTETMFNYTSDGTDVLLGGTNFADTSGMYKMEDDDGESYFYRGNVNNLVQFGEYKQDYYVYRYSSYDFVSLEACQYYNSSCSESNKVKKYEAGTPMYWKIIRVNGDGTIRMIYAGGEEDAIGYDTGIGISRYDETRIFPDSTGYTFNRDADEIDSSAKIEIDNWYNTYLSNTEYDNYVAEGKFCSDTSGYQVNENVNDEVNSDYYFASFSRLIANTFGYNTENTIPTFKCPKTTETYGGSYTLKVGLITMDEVVAAGGHGRYKNNQYYLYNWLEGQDGGRSFWSMSPLFYDSVGNMSDDGSINWNSVNDSSCLLRPVINLKADTTFVYGGAGTIGNPYVVELQ